MRALRRAGYFLATMLTVAIGTTSCTGSTGNARKAGGQSCVADGDCEPGLVCGLGVTANPTCTPTCSKTADCQGGAVCITPSNGSQSYCGPPCTASTRTTDLCIDG